MRKRKNMEEATGNGFGQFVDIEATPVEASEMERTGVEGVAGRPRRSRGILDLQELCGQQPVLLRRASEEQKECDDYDAAQEQQLEQVHEHQEEEEEDDTTHPTSKRTRHMLMAVPMPSLFSTRSRCMGHSRRRTEVTPFSGVDAEDRQPRLHSDSVAEQKEALEGEGGDVECVEEAAPPPLVELLVMLHPKAHKDANAAARLRKQFLSASPDKQRDVLHAAVAAAKRQRRDDLLARFCV